MGDLPLSSHLLVFLVLGAAFVVVFWVVPLWFICRKAGFSPWLTLLNCIPLGNAILLYLLAFAEWQHKPMFVPAPPAPVKEPQPAAGPQQVAREA